jgi:hypothetical protein
VLTSIKPLQLIAAAVQDGVAVPEVLLPPGASPHNYALRPSDVRRVQSADLLYWIGPDMEGFLPRVLKGRNLPTVTVQELPGLKLRHFAEDHHSHGEEADDHDHDHRPGTLDAHLWLSPVNARVIAARMAADLSAADPANAERYQSNLQAFNGRLDALDLRLKAAPDGDRRQAVTSSSTKPSITLKSAYGLKHTGDLQRGRRGTAGCPACGGDAHAPAGSGQDLRVQRATACARAWPTPWWPGCRSNWQSWMPWAATPRPRARGMSSCWRNWVTIWQGAWSRCNRRHRTPVGAGLCGSGLARDSGVSGADRRLTRPHRGQARSHSVRGRTAVGEWPAGAAPVVAGTPLDRESARPARQMTRQQSAVTAKTAHTPRATWSATARLPWR